MLVVWCISCPIVQCLCAYLFLLKSAFPHLTVCHSLLSVSVHVGLACPFFPAASLDPPVNATEGSSPILPDTGVRLGKVKYFAQSQQLADQQTGLSNSAARALCLMSGCLPSEERSRTRSQNLQDVIVQLNVRTF